MATSRAQLGPSLPTCTRDATAASAAAAGQRQRKRRSQTQSASQAVRQEREQPPSAHTSASCTRFEPAESTGEPFRTSERGGERLRPGGGRRRRRRCPLGGRPISPPGPAPARAPFRAIPLSAAATVLVPATNLTAIKLSCLGNLSLSLTFPSRHTRSMAWDSAAT